MNSLGRHRRPPLGWLGLEPGKEDPAKRNGSQAVGPGNKAASHWLPVTSLLVKNNLRRHKKPPVPAPSCGGQAGRGRWPSRRRPRGEETGRGRGLAQRASGLRLSQTDPESWPWAMGCPLTPGHRCALSRACGVSLSPSPLGQQDLWGQARPQVSGPSTHEVQIKWSPGCTGTLGYGPSPRKARSWPLSRREARSGGRGRVRGQARLPGPTSQPSDRQSA